MSDELDLSDLVNLPDATNYWMKVDSKLDSLQKLLEKDPIIGLES